MVTAVGARAPVVPKTTDAQGAACPLMPIATNRATVADIPSGTAIRDILNGARPGQRGWLTWTGDVSEPVLATSLTLPGDSDTYRNPADATDHSVSVGDWVAGRPGVVNSRAVRDALEALIGREIVVPLWDTARGQGANAAYHVSGFARFSITDYELPKDNRIGARYLGPTDCLPTPSVPEAVGTSATTPEDTPVAISLTGRSPVPETLNFVLAPPQHGAVVFAGASSCTTVQVPGAAAACSLTVTYTPTPDFNGGDGIHVHGRRRRDDVATWPGHGERHARQRPAGRRDRTRSWCGRTRRSRCP